MNIDLSSIAALRAVNVGSIYTNQQAIVSGYYTPGDGGDGLFCFNSSSTATDDGGAVIAPTSGSGRWLRIVNGPCSIRSWGAKGDGSTDDTLAIQATLDFAVNNNFEALVPQGSFLSGTLIWKGCSIIGQGYDISAIIGKPASDVFYVPDPSIGESGSLSQFPEGGVVQDLKVIVDVSSAGSFPFRRSWPVNGNWAATISIVEGTYYKTTADRIYYALQGGTTSSTEPAFTAGVSSDGSVLWYHVAESNPTYAQAAFAFALKDGSVSLSTAGYINKISWIRVWIDVQGTNAGGAVGFFIQRPAYACRWQDVILRPGLDNGFIQCAPYLNPSSYDWSPDTCQFVKIETNCIVPFRMFSGHQSIISGLSIYAETAGDLGFELWPLNTSSSGVPGGWSIGGLYVENSSSSTGRLGVVSGDGHFFSGGGFKTSGGSGYYDFLSKNCRLSDVFFANDGSNPPIQFYGNNNQFKNISVSTLYMSLDSIVADYGLGNSVEIGSCDSTSFESERLVIAQNGRARPPMGYLGSEWLTQGCYSAPFFDMLIGMRELLDFGGAFLPIADASLETGGYARRTSFSGFNSWISCRQHNTIGTRFPATKCRIVIKGRLSGSFSAYIVINARTQDGLTNTTVGAINPTWSSSWQIFTLDVDLTLYSARDLSIEFDNPSGGSFQDIAWIAVIPYDVISLTQQILFPNQCTILSGAGSPAGVISAPIGSLFLRSDGGSSTCLYVKESGSGSSGWAAK